MGANISVNAPHHRGEYASITLRRSQGVFEPYSPLTSQCKAVLQSILRPTKDSLERSSIWLYAIWWIFILEILKFIA